MTAATDPAIFKMGNFNVELDKLRDWKKKPVNFSQKLVIALITFSITFRLTTAIL